MISVSAVSAGAMSSKYYHEEGYYKDGEEQGKATSFWHGQAAKEEGLIGQVNDEVFVKLAEGTAPDGVDLSRNGQSGNKRVIGFDYTFSAPKSVSVVALIGGDSRIIEAHNKAVRTTLDLAEQESLKVRVYNKEAKGKEWVSDQKGIFAVFQHDTSRKLDPQLHSHAIILNMAKGEDDKYRAIGNRDFYKNRKFYDAVYKAELAAGLKELGYDLTRGQKGDIKIKGVGKEVTETFSKRSQEIREMVKNSTDPNKSAASERAALATRSAKNKDVDRSEVLDVWQKESREAGLSTEKLNTMVANSREHEGIPVSAADKAKEANHIYKYARDHFSERDAVYGLKNLKEEMLDVSVGLTLRDIETKITKEMDKGKLFYAGKIKDEIQITDNLTLAAEGKMLTEFKESLGKSAPSQNFIQKYTTNFHRRLTQNFAKTTLTVGQQDAARLILNSKDRVVGIQGYAGSGKTFMLNKMETIANTNGYAVEGIGPTSKSVEALKDAGIDSKTVASFLMQSRTKIGDKSKTILVIDEASMVGTKDMAELLKVGNLGKYNRVVVMGDVAQLDSVSAGSAFSQLQKNGMSTANMLEINRQSNQNTLAAVYATISKDIENAFANIGNIHESTDGDYVRPAANAYLDRSPEQRKNTGVIAQTNVARIKINNIIREGLIEEGAIGQSKIAVEHLYPSNFSNAMKQFGLVYETGQLVVAHQDLPDTIVKQGDIMAVRTFKPTTGTLEVVNKSGEAVSINASSASVAAKIGVFTSEVRTFSEGDEVIFKMNVKEENLMNGDRGVIKDVQGKNITIEKTNGDTVTLDSGSLSAKRMDHAYASTVHGYQGETVHDIIVAMGSNEILSTQKSFYVSISRPKDTVALYTDSATDLANTIEENTGQSIPALQAVAEAEKENMTSDKIHEDTKTEEMDVTEKDINKERADDNLRTTQDRDAMQTNVERERADEAMSQSDDIQKTKPTVEMER